MDTRLTAGFPAALSANVIEVQERVRSDRSPSGALTVRVGLELLTIPDRLYCREPLFTQFSGTERAIAACAFTRNPSGHVRERWLRELLTRREPWVCPYVFGLIGDYVPEIVQLIHSQLERLDVRAYRELVAHNPAFVELVRQRATSYWDRYWRGPGRGFRRFEDTPAYALLARFEAVRPAQARATAPVRAFACG